MKRSLSMSAVALTLSASLHAQVNSWIKPSSGRWEEPFWSLGTPPDFTQSGVMFSNGWQALAIGAATVRDRPDSLRIQEMTVLAPPNASNTFLLNYAGLQMPLDILRNFTLGSNSFLLTLASKLRVGGDFLISGTVNHGELSEVAGFYIFVGERGRHGAYNLTNGVLNAGTLLIGINASGTFNQYGGSNQARIAQVARGDYYLHGGDVAVQEDLEVGLGGSGYLRHTGGHMAAGHLLLGRSHGSGRYSLVTGVIDAGATTVGAGGFVDASNGYFEQLGGSNHAGMLRIGALSDRSGTGSYTLYGGTLLSSSSYVAVGGLLHWDGIHIVQGPLTVEGYLVRDTAINATYELNQGKLISRSLRLSNARFTHANGINEVQGDLVLQPNWFDNTMYRLINGQVTASNTIIRDTWNGGFQQEGGVHHVRGLLHLTTSNTRYLGYGLFGGELVVRDIELDLGAIFRHTGGTIVHGGSLKLAGGDWEAAAGDHQLGPLQLVGNSGIYLPYPATATLRLANSAAAPWLPNAQVIIHNWQGNTNGGGVHRVYFGTDQSGLNSQQLSQVRFQNPLSLAPGNYRARILATGEVVPAESPPIIRQYLPNGLVLQWPPEFTLQTATEVTGPYTDLTNVPNPYFVAFDEPQRFFRLRL